jgi:hypothetical protein
MTQLEEIRRDIYSSEVGGERKRIRRAGALFREVLLFAEDFPPDCLSLILEIVSNKEVFHKSGIDFFFGEMMTDVLRLNDEQKVILLESLRQNYSWYDDLDICWMVGDLVARNYPVQSALAFFEAVAKTAAPQGREGIALGLDVIYKNNKNDNLVLNKAKSILKAMSA